MIPAAVITFLMFTVPKGQTIGMIYVLVTNVLLTAVIYTMIATPFGASYGCAYQQPGRTKQYGYLSVQ